jgi:hypothetical protein
MQMASNDRSGLEGTPIFMAPELFDGSARPNEAADVHALGETCRAVHRDRVRVGRCEAVVAGKGPEWPADRRVIGSLRSFAACGYQTPPLAPSCRTFCSSSTRNDADADGDSDSDDRSSVDEIVRKLSLRERDRERRGREPGHAGAAGDRAVQDDPRRGRARRLPVPVQGDRHAAWLRHHRGGAERQVARRHRQVPRRQSDRLLCVQVRPGEQRAHQLYPQHGGVRGRVVHSAGQGPTQRQHSDRRPGPSGAHRLWLHL